MSENATQVPVAEIPPVESKENASQAQSKVASPAQDLRDIQYLLLNGIFPGNVAPAVVKAYQLLEKMSLQIEASPNEQK